MGFNIFKRKKVICSNSHDLGCVDCLLWIYNHDESKAKSYVHVSDKYKSSLLGCKNFKLIKKEEKPFLIPKLSDMEHRNRFPV